jgi:hypothetical protein
MAPKLKFQGFAFLCWAEILRCAQQKKCAMGGVARKLHPTVSAGGTTAEPSAALVPGVGVEPTRRVSVRGF